MAEQEHRLKFMASEFLHDEQPEKPKSTVASRMGMGAWGLGVIPIEKPLDLSKMTGFSYYNSGSIERLEKHATPQQEPPREKYL